MPSVSETQIAGSVGMSSTLNQNTTLCGRLLAGRFPVPSETKSLSPSKRSEPGLLYWAPG